MSKVVLFFPIIECVKNRLLPLSLLLVAAPLVKEGYSVKIIDQGVEDDWKEKLLNELKQEPLLVGFSLSTGRQILYGLEVSKLVKQNSNTKVVWGGFHPSLSPEQTLKNKFVDIVVIREGEETLLELVDRIDKRQSYNDILGIGYKDNGQVYINPHRDFIDLDKQAAIPYHLVDIEKYIASQSFSSGKLGRDLAIYTSRGCPHQCAFCYNKRLNQQRWRGQSAEVVVGELKKLVNDYQITSFNIQDDEFFTDLERVRKICQLILAENIKLEFMGCCRINDVCRMDEDFLKLISQSGFRTLGIGIESGSPRILQMIKKDIEISQILEAVKKIKKFNIEGKFLFMVGFPKESINDMHQTADLMRVIKKINPFARISPWRVFTPFPGTDLYKIAIENGWRSPNSLEEWAYYDFETIRMPWIDRQKKNIINNVTYLVKFLRLQDKPLSLPYRILGKWVDFRWKNHLFSFLPEKYLIEAIDYFRKRF